LAIKIAITGPESTGKSQLSEELARKYQTLYVPEYAREYLKKLNRKYTHDDVELIARGQMALEQEKTKQAKKLLFLDTELIVIKIWMEFKYGSCPQFIINYINNNKNDMYFLMDIDLPWQPDPQREHPGLRKYFFHKFEDELKLIGANYRIIGGIGKTRFSNAVNYVNDLIRGLN